MNPEHSSPYFVAFIDLLGFSDMVKKDLEAPLGTQKYMDKLYRIHKKTLELNKSTLDLQLVQFSDSIVLATKFDKSNFPLFLNIISEYQYNLLQEGILVRGGITYGKHFYNDGFMYSLGLIEAYHLESKVARFPRIIVSKDLIELLYEDQMNLSDLGLLQEYDGHYFVDYLENGNNETMENLLGFIVEGAKFNNTSVREKYVWLLDYSHFKFPEIPISNQRFISNY
ncbi:hypothetical protein [Planococcus halotolerans]|uniref:Guanylate cyclase domain-containing protein n=1 Tax=Planococcus halotolerans TaxID=2233542 RepID=A0A365KX00_9BACL|nr:hypothetical protein [Planococcus halotolerans]QHJ72278.1 hypothetical protein DNR44_017455 [Planococcus halotolerans]RAZ77701.1 hypothetical protein DP120_09460 [Planococcus halotolerans]